MKNPILAKGFDPFTLILKDPIHVPFGSIVMVEISSPPITDKKNNEKTYPLGGTTMKYHNPFDRVAEMDWEMIK